MRSSGRQPSFAASSGVSGFSTSPTLCVAQPTVIISAWLWPSTKWENQSWVMN